MAFDLLSSQYGWTDEVIHNLTLRRFRQAIVACRRRLYLEGREQKSLFSWLARTQSSYVAGGYMTDGKGNPALDAAMKISFDKIEELELEEAAKRQAEIPVENKPGSFERLMGGFR